MGSAEVVDVAGKVVQEAGGHGPLVFLSTLVLVFAGLMCAAVVFGMWKALVWTAPQAKLVVESHLDLLTVMKADKASEAEDRRGILDAKQRHADAVEKIWEELKRRGCNYPTNSSSASAVSSRAGDAG